MDSPLLLVLLLSFFKVHVFRSRVFYGIFSVYGFWGFGILEMRVAGSKWGES